MSNLNWLQLLKLELKALITNPVISLTMFGGVIFYSFLYPLPYAHQVVEELPISVVNLDNSQVSYKLERMIDATPQLHVIHRDHSIEAAKQKVLEEETGGFIVIPKDFHRDLLLGKSPTLSYAGDASYFLVYGGVVEGLAQASGTLAAEVKVARLLADGTPISQAENQYSAIKTNMKPTFNPRMGYVDYVVPAVFVLILQQTLVMASGLIGATQKSLVTCKDFYWCSISSFKLFTVRTIALIMLYFMLSMYYFGFSFEFYGINRLGSIADVLSFLVPFLIASISIGVCLGAWLPRRELVTVIVLVSSMPLIFTAGFIWPIEMIPEILNQMAALFPSTPAIQGFLALNQMDATGQQVSGLYSHLWIQAVVWSMIAIYSLHRSQPTIKS